MAARTSKLCVKVPGMVFEYSPNSKIVQMGVWVTVGLAKFLQYPMKIAVRGHDMADF
jgi:hypothetical protein